MYIFFDGVSSRGYIGLFGEDKKLLKEENFYISGNESSKAIPLIDSFLSQNNIAYKDIENIITVVGPGSFTGVRTVSLIVNTLAYTYPNIYLTPLNFFDLYDQYPIVKSSSKRDLFVKWKKSATIEVLSNADFESLSKDTLVYGDTDICRFQKEIHIDSHIDYKNIMSGIKLQKLKQVAPLYIKKPNIS